MKEIKSKIFIGLLIWSLCTVCFVIFENDGLLSDSIDSLIAIIIVFVVIPWVAKKIGSLIDSPGESQPIIKTEEELISLVGQEGFTVTPMIPVGKIKISDKEYSAIANVDYLPMNTKVRTIEVFKGEMLKIEKVSE